MTTEFKIKNFIDTLESKEYRKEKNGYKAQYLAKKSAEVAQWHIMNGFRDRKMREDLCEALHDAGVAKSVIKVVNEAQEHDAGFVIEFVIVLKDVIDTQRRKLGSDDDILKSYEVCIHKILKKDIKEMVKATGISKELAYELLVVLPTTRIVPRKNVIGIYVNRINRKLYLAEEKGLDTITRLKTIRQIFKFLFGDDESMPEIALSILLERRGGRDSTSSAKIYSLLTVFALDTLEKLPKEEVRDCIKRYAERRKNEREGDRRINISSISPEDYPKLSKAIKKVKKKHPELKDFL